MQACTAWTELRFRHCIKFFVSFFDAWSLPEEPYFCRERKTIKNVFVFRSANRAFHFDNLRQSVDAFLSIFSDQRRQSDHERSRHEFASCAHRLKIYWRAKQQEIGPADNSCFLTLHSGYEDPRLSILADDDVILINVDKDGATFGKFPGLGPVDLVNLILIEARELNSKFKLGSFAAISSPPRFVFDYVIVFAKLLLIDLGAVQILSIIKLQIIKYLMAKDELQSAKVS